MVHYFLVAASDRLGFIVNPGELKYRVYHERSHVQKTVLSDS